MPSRACGFAGRNLVSLTRQLKPLCLKFLMLAKSWDRRIHRHYSSSSHALKTKSKKGSPSANPRNHVTVVTMMRPTTGTARMSQYHDSIQGKARFPSEGCTLMDYRVRRDGVAEASWWCGWWCSWLSWLKWCAFSITSLASMTSLFSLSQSSAGS